MTEDRGLVTKVGPNGDRLCDRCGGTTWERADPTRHSRTVEIWGLTVLTCHRCGAIRRPGELEAT